MTWGEAWQGRAEPGRATWGEFGTGLDAARRESHRETVEILFGRVLDFKLGRFIAMQKRAQLTNALMSRVENPVG